MQSDNVFEENFDSVDDIEYKFKKTIQCGLVSEAKDFARRRQIKPTSQKAIARKIFDETIAKLSTKKKVMQHEISMPFEIANTFNFNKNTKKVAVSVVHDYCKTKKDSNTIKRIQQEFPEYFNF